MDPVAATRRLYASLCSDASGARLAGLKALVLDAFTARALTLAVTQESNVEHEVVANLMLKDLPGAARLQHVVALYYICPTAENVQQICAELSRDKAAQHFGSCYINFTSPPPGDVLEKLGQADKAEAVKGVRVCFGEFLALGPTFSVVPTVANQYSEAPTGGIASAGRTTSLSSVYTRSFREDAKTIAQRLFSRLVAGGTQPFAVRFTGGSAVTSAVADHLYRQVQQQQALFEFNDRCLRRHQGAVHGQAMSPVSQARRAGPDAEDGAGRRKPLEVVIFDRRADMITPLTYYRTFEALVDAFFSLRDKGHVQTDSREGTPLSYATCGDHYRRLAYADYFNTCGVLLPDLKSEMTVPAAPSGAGYKERAEAAVRQAERAGARQGIANMYTVALALNSRVEKVGASALFAMEELLAGRSPAEAVAEYDAFFVSSSAGARKYIDAAPASALGSPGTSRSEVAVFFASAAFKIAVAICLRFNAWSSAAGAVKKLQASSQGFFKLARTAAVNTPSAPAVEKYAEATARFLQTTGPRFFTEHCQFLASDSLETAARSAMTWISDAFGDSLGRPEIASTLQALPRDKLERAAAMFPIRPRVLQVAEAAIASKLPEDLFPYVSGADLGLARDICGSGQLHNVLVFVVGGVSFGEAAALSSYEFYAQHASQKGLGRRVGLGDKVCVALQEHAEVCGTGVLSMADFLEDLSANL